MTDRYNRFRDELEDFWDRRGQDPVFTRPFRIFGCPFELQSNREEVRPAADFSAALYSTAAPVDRPPFRIQAAVRAERSAGPAPDDLPRRIRYTGAGDWIHLDLGPWGSVHADLAAGTAVAVLEPAMAEAPELLSRAVLNTLINNFLTHAGYAMLHATALIEGDRALMLMAPHNTGKSTTALRLTLSGGYRLLSDSQVYVKSTAAGVQLTGFPVGRGKLRRDMLPFFPELEGRLTQEQVRDETKFVLDLRSLDPDLVITDALFPQRVDWCLLARTDRPETAVRPAAIEEVWEAIMLNSLHYDARAHWEANLAEIEPLVAMANFYHLELGTDTTDLVEIVNGRMGE